MHTNIETTQISNTHDELLVEVMKDVRAIVASLDGALNIVAKVAAGPCKVLLRTREVALAIIDEGQRSELLPGCAIFGAHLDSLGPGRQQPKHRTPQELCHTVSLAAARQRRSESALAHAAEPDADMVARSVGS